MFLPSFSRVRECTYIACGLAVSTLPTQTLDKHMVTVSPLTAHCSLLKLVGRRIGSRRDLVFKEVNTDSQIFVAPICKIKTQLQVNVLMRSSKDDI